MRKNNETDMKLGAVLFDNPRTPGTGLACIAGSGNSVKRISNPEDLPADTVWWSNVPVDCLSNLQKEGKLACLRHERYFRTSPEQVLQEWGVRKSLPVLATDPVKQCEFLARVFKTVMTLSYRLVLECTGDLPFSRVFTGMGLSDDLEVILPKPADIKGLYRFDRNAVKHSRGIVTTCERSIGPDRKLRVIKNRMLHAREVLNCTVPEIDVPLKFRQNGQLAATDSNANAGHLHLQFPAMTRVIIDRIGDRYASLFGIGKEMKLKRKEFEQWVSIPELAALSKCAQLKVFGGWFCSSYGQYLDFLDKPVRDFLNGTQFECSWSSGIIAESILVAAARMEKSYRHLSGRRIGPFSNRNWQADCIAGANRRSMYDKSYSAAKFGFTVYSYGYGWMFAGAGEDFVPNFIRHSWENGLIPFPADPSRDLVDSITDYRTKGTGVSSLLDLGMATGDSLLILKLDMLPFLQPDEGKQLLRELAEKHQKQPY